jgi:hypothetical protein
MTRKDLGLAVAALALCLLPSIASARDYYGRGYHRHGRSGFSFSVGFGGYSGGHYGRGHYGRGGYYSVGYSSYRPSYRSYGYYDGPRYSSYGYYRPAAYSYYDRYCYTPRYVRSYYYCDPPVRSYYPRRYYRGYR